MEIFKNQACEENLPEVGTFHGVRMARSVRVGEASSAKRLSVVIQKVKLFRRSKDCVGLSYVIILCMSR
jgi:hypothetical protein